MAKVDGGFLAAKVLKSEGVSQIFTLHGGHIQRIWDACVALGIQIVDSRHEQGAAFMADGWARITGQPGVTVTTAGPGVTNTVTATVNAFKARSPIVLIGGQSPRHQFDAGPIQDVDQSTLFSSITNWSRTVVETERIPEYVSAAFRHALTPNPGPSFLAIPLDLLRTEVEDQEIPPPMMCRASSRMLGDTKQIERAADLLAQAERPVVLACTGIRWADASGELQRFAELVGAPVVLSGMARGALPATHSLRIVHSRRTATLNADVVLVVGGAFDFRLGHGQAGKFSPKAKIIQVHTDPTEIGWNRPVDVGILGDSGEVLRQLTSAFPAKAALRSAVDRWVQKLREGERKRQAELGVLQKSDAVPIHPMRVYKEVDDFLGSNAIIVGDGGNFVSMAASVMSVRGPAQWLDPGPYGCLGVGIPFGIAAKLAKPDKQVLILNGDGAFGLTAMEFDTAVRHKVPIVSVIGNNGCWGSEEYAPGLALGLKKAIGIDLGFTRYDKMVEALGGHGEWVDEPNQIRPALERAFNSGVPACVNVKIDASVMGESTRASMNWWR